MMLLEDVFIIENLQVLNEGRGSGPMKIRGCFQRADEENNNKRVYRKPLLEREITKLADAMSERRLLGELDHPQHDSVKLSNVSHLITALSMKGNEVIGEAEILNTPAGKVAQALIEGGVKIGVSSRGMGTVTEELDGKRYVNEDFRLITWDIVADPSTRGAYPGLTESTIIQEIIDTVYPEAQKVKNFTTLLKEELLTETISKGKKQGGSRPSTDTQRHRMGAKAASEKPIVTDPNMRALVTPVERRTDSDERRKAREAAANDKKKSQQEYNTSQQISSTQFVNFMRDKLVEWLTVESTPAGREESKKVGQKHGLGPRFISLGGEDLGPEIRGHGGPAWNAKEKAQKEGQAAVQRGKVRVRLAAKKGAEAQNSSTQFVNFMRDKLVEAKKKKKSTSRWEETEKGSTIFVKTAAAKRADRGQPPISPELQNSAEQGMGLTIRKRPRTDSSTQFVNFMRDKLMEMKMQIHPIAKKYGKKRMKDKSRPRIKDPVVRTAAWKYQKRVGKKIGAKVNLPADVAVQGSMNVRRRRAKAGKSVPGSPRMRPESKADRRADFDRDKWRRQAPGDR